MAKPSKKHEPLLLPETTRSQPIKWPLLWVGLVILGLGASFWRDATSESDATRKHAVEMRRLEQQELERLKVQKKMEKLPMASGKGK